jgi:sporulation protein YlmC with PRC-barrel domain
MTAGCLQQPATFSDAGAKAAAHNMPNTHRLNAKEIAMTTPSGHTSAIRAKKVIGTAVKNQSGQKIGQVEDIVLDKLSNNIIYAVVGFGGFLGVKEKFHPVPWSALDYVESEDSYVVPFTREQLEAAPADSLDALTRNDATAGYATRANDYYKVPRAH